MLSGVTGAVKFALATPTTAENTIADLDGDGVPEIVSSVKVWNNKGGPPPSKGEIRGLVDIGRLNKGR